MGMFRGAAMRELPGRASRCETLVALSPNVGRATGESIDQCEATLVPC